MDMFLMLAVATLGGVLGVSPSCHFALHNLSNAYINIIFYVDIQKLEGGAGIYRSVPEAR